LIEYTYGNVEENGIELLLREKASDQHRPVKLIHHDLQVAAIFQFSLKQLRNDLAPLRPPLAAFSAHQWRENNATARNSVIKQSSAALKKK
jgi:hypothetical protein